ncbi:hypothetical protein I4U23_010981 [Adineta vaga]|nr:hypothetical protein I4U23_010981 [Adineta vaga]
MYIYATITILFIIVGYKPIDIDCFFASPLTSTYAINNITCANSTISTGNSTGFVFIPYPIYSFCVILVGISATGQTIMVQQPIQSPWVDLSWVYNLGGSGSNTDHPKQYGWIRMSQTRCTGFSPSSDIGYGPCTSLS